MRPQRTLPVLLLTWIVIASMSWLPANGATGDQHRIDEIIAQYGGVQIGPTTISWDQGSVLLDLDTQPTAEVAAATSVCSTGSFCAFGGVSYSGTKLTFSTCPATHTSFPTITVRSIYNNRSSRTVRAYASTSLRTTLGPGTGAPNVSGITKITCS